MTALSKKYNHSITTRLRYYFLFYMILRPDQQCANTHHREYLQSRIHGGRIVSYRIVSYRGSFVSLSLSWEFQMPTEMRDDKKSFGSL